MYTVHKLGSTHLLSKARVFPLLRLFLSRSLGLVHVRVRVRVLPS